jgi:spermidine synthase
MRILHLAYAVSGLVSLGYQVYWLRHFVDRFGSSTFTFVLVIASFVLGLGLGALASRRLVAGIKRTFPRADDLTLYGAIELAIAASVLLVFVEARVPLDALGHFPYAEHGGIYEPRFTLELLRTPLAAASVIVPCFFMGTTFPLLCRAFPAQSRLPSALYAWNTLGACIAVLACEFVLVRKLGTDAMLWVFLALNVALGLAFLAGGRSLLGRCTRDPAQASSTPATVSGIAARVAPALGGLVAGAVISGFLSGALEADAFRRVHFAQIYNGAAMAFVSFWAIAAIFVSSALVHRWRGLSIAHVRIAFVAALVLHVVITRVLLLPTRMWLASLEATAAGRFAWDPEGQLLLLAAMFAIVGLITFPCYACIALLLPHLCNRAQDAEQHLGVLYGTNTLAFLLGMVAFSWLAPAVNMFYAFNLCEIALAILVAMLFLFDERRAPRTRLVAGTLAALALAALFAPRDFDHEIFPKSHVLRTSKIRALKGSSAFTSFVAETPEGDAVFLDTGQMSNTSPVAQRYMKLMVHFPLLAQPAPRSALLICFGVGNTGGALGKHAGLREIDVVDLSRNILETAPEFAITNDAIYEDPRVRRIHDDGRAFLDVTDRVYDLVTSEPPPPLMQGISRLYSEEYYAAVLRHLTPRGCMTQWLPVSQMPPGAGRLIVSTFVQSFPHTLLLTGCDTEFLLVGSKSAIDLACIARRFHEDAAVFGDLNDIQVPSVVSLLARIVVTGDELGRDFGREERISDQRNQLSAYWPTGPMLTFPYDPRAIIAALPTELLAARPELAPTLLDAHRLRRAVPDFPAASLALGAHAAAADWLELERMNGRAGRMLREGDAANATQVFEQSLARMPEQMQVLLTLGGYDLARGQPSSAATRFRQCTERFPEFEDGHLALAIATMRMGQMDVALASVRAALAINPDFFDAHLVAVQILQRAGHIREAEQHGRDAHRLKPRIDLRGLPGGAGSQAASR